MDEIPDDTRKLLLFFLSVVFVCGYLRQCTYSQEMFSEIFADEVSLSHNLLSSGKAKTCACNMYTHIYRTNRQSC